MRNLKIVFFCWRQNFSKCVIKSKLFKRSIKIFDYVRFNWNTNHGRSQWLNDEFELFLSQVLQILFNKNWQSVILIFFCSGRRFFI